MPKRIVIIDGHPAPGRSHLCHALADAYAAAAKQAGHEVRRIETMPALLKGFFEQAIRPGFAIDFKPNGMWNKRLKGRSARVVVTMGMPALIYRWFFGAHSLKSLERNILRFAGIAPVRETLFGGIESASDARRQKWLDRMKALGARGR